MSDTATVWSDCSKPTPSSARKSPNEDAALAPAIAALHDPETRPVVRRWDSVGLQDLIEETAIDLVDGANTDGLQVLFEAGRVWRPGDYWTVAARTAILPGTVDRQIDWPVDDLGDPLVLEAKGTKHHVARLGLAELAGDAWTMLSDCREEFAPLSDHITFVGRGGDGQETLSGHWLPRPLFVGVSHGSHPIEGREVQFQIENGGGEITAHLPNFDGTATGPVGASITTTTGADGMALLWWRLGQAPNPPLPGDTFVEANRQTVIATLLDDVGANASQEVRFFAQAKDPYILVAAGGDGQWGWPGETLEIAPRARVSDGSNPRVGSLVEFEVVTRMENGTALDQVGGGSIHASGPGVVETENWPGGSTAFRAVVRTDGEGVAQVQWRLGTEPELPVQRLYARLLTDDGAPTGHFTFFTAHHAVADEVRWDPCPDLLQFLPTANTGRHTVQDGLDLFCELFVAGARGRLRTPAGEVRPLSPSTVLAAAEFPSIEMTMPGAFSAPSTPALQQLLEVSLVFDVAPFRDRRIVLGNVQTTRVGADTRITWTLLAEQRSRLLAVMRENNQNQWLALVTLRPSMFGQSQFFSDWTGGFRISETAGPIDPRGPGDIVNPGRVVPGDPRGPGDIVNPGRVDPIDPRGPGDIVNPGRVNPGGPVRPS